MKVGAVVTAAAQRPVFVLCRERSLDETLSARIPLAAFRRICSDGQSTQSVEELL